jgi:hypothetical protein
MFPAFACRRLFAYHNGPAMKARARIKSAGAVFAEDVEKMPRLMHTIADND